MLRLYFINSLLSSGIVATVASIFYPILKFVIPPETAESAVMSVSAGRPEDVQPRRSYLNACAVHEDAGDHGQRLPVSVFGLDSPRGVIFGCARGRCVLLFAVRPGDLRFSTLDPFR